MGCKICTSPLQLLCDSKVGIVYYYCNQCSFISLQESKILSPEKERQRYLQHINTPEDSQYVQMMEQFIQKSILPFHSHIHTALDFGCGPGPVLATLLKNRGYHVDTYDLYFAPKKVYLYHTYDLITCTEVLEHLQNPLDTLTLFKELLNPGGILAIMTLFHPLETPTAQEFFQWWYRRDATHISFFNPQTFQYIARTLNLELIFIDQKNTLTFKKRDHLTKK